MNSGTDIVNKIKYLQRQRNWSINHLGMESEVSAATISNWYKRKAIPSIKALGNICAAFGITMSEFFNENETPLDLTNQQKELLTEWNLLHKTQKDELLSFIKATNIIVKKSNPL